jgi:hypothetical protein
VPKSPQDIARSNQLAKKIKGLVDQEQNLRSFREIQRRLHMEHPALLRIIDGTTFLLGERAKWSLFKIGRYFGTDFDEDWLTPYINPKAGEAALLAPPTAESAYQEHGAIGGGKPGEIGSEGKIAEEDIEDFEQVYQHAAETIRSRKRAKKKKTPTKRKPRK